MTHYNITYDANNKAVADEKAIKDCQEYLGEKGWAFMMDNYFSLNDVGGVKIGYQDKKERIKSLRFACTVAGIKGYPVAALCRKFLAQFKS